MRLFGVSFLILIHCFFSAQTVEIKTLKDTIEYKSGEKTTIDYQIKNTSKNKVYLVIDKQKFGAYLHPNKFYWDENSKELHQNKDENIFAPRIILENPKKEVLGFNNIATSLLKYENLLKIDSIKNIKEQEELKELAIFQKSNFPKKNLIWNKRAKIINENFIILNPNEIINISVPIDLANYEYDELSQTGVGFLLNENIYYTGCIVLENDQKRIIEYLNSENHNKIKMVNANAVNKRTVSKSFIVKALK